MKNNKKKKEKKVQSIYSYVILMLIVTLIIYGGIILFNSAKYGKYADKMDDYGLSELYDNQKSSSSQKLTKSELVKVIVGSITGDRDMADYAEYNEYTNEPWIKYAERMKIIEENSITKDNESDRAKTSDASVILKSSIKVLLNKDEIISDPSGIILIKGKLNKCIIEIVEKYATIQYNSQATAKIVTDENKLPANYKEYPYIVDSISNNVYEMPLDIVRAGGYSGPINQYKTRKTVYMQIDDYISKYYDTILNIDYETITEESFFNSIKDILYYDYEQSIVDKYVKYVKDNKIRLDGECKVLLPIIYDDGEEVRVRVKIKFAIIRSETDENILFPDVFNGVDVEYKNKMYEFYADIPMGQLLDSISMRMTINSLPNYIVSKNIGINYLEGGVK